MVRVGMLFVLFLMVVYNSQSQSTKPNIIYILADDLGIGDLSCYGQTLFSTPNIDKLANEGMLFTQHYSGSTVCAPSRSVLLTGQHTGHTYIRGNKEVSPEGQYPLEAEAVTVAELLKDVGYITGAFGKWGLGYPGSEGDPTNQGFDTFFGYNCQRLAHNYYTYHLWNDQQKILLDANNGNATGVYSPQLIHEKTLKFIEDNKESPFFLFVPSIIPHAELLVPDDYLARYRGMFNPEHSYYGVDDGPTFRKGAYGTQLECHAAFAAMISMLDDQVGDIVDKLDKLGLSDNTIIFFSSDNGAHREGGAQPDYFNSNGPFRGYKRDLYEGGIRAPLIVKWSNHIAPGTSSELVSAFWDFLPTVADITKAISHENCDGVSILPELLNLEGQKTHEFLYWEFHEGAGRQAIRMQEWKGVRHNVKNDIDAQWELYNLEKDISETINLAETEPGIIAKFDEILQNVRNPSSIFPFTEVLTPSNFSGQPEACFNFDGNANDYCGNQWNATGDGITFISSDPERGKVADFNSDYLTITGNKGWKEAEARSITAWIKTTTPNRLIIASGTKATGQKFSFLINNDGTLRVEVEGGYLYGTTFLTDGKWHHVACTFENDGSPNVSDVKLYVDGKLETIGNLLPVQISTRYGIDIQIGKDFYRDDRNYQGRLDDLHLWSEALSAEEVATQYNLPTLIKSGEVGQRLSWNIEHKTVRIENTFGRNVLVVFYNLSGEKIREIELVSGENSIHFTKAGVYIAVMKTDLGMQSHKIIIT